MKLNTVIHGNVLEVLKQIPSNSIDCIITSPPKILNISNTLISGMREYLAGLIDGDGSILIKKTTYRIRNPKYKDCVNPEYFPRIQIKLTTPQPLFLIKEKYGGSLYMEKRIYRGKNSYKPTKPLWVYNANHKIAMKIIKDIYPFLIIKRKQAECLIELEKLKKEARKRRPYPKHIVKKFEELYLKVKRLNRGDAIERETNTWPCTGMSERNT